MITKLMKCEPGTAVSKSKRKGEKKNFDMQPTTGFDGDMVSTTNY